MYVGDRVYFEGDVCLIMEKLDDSGTCRLFNFTKEEFLKESWSKILQEATKTYVPTDFLKGDEVGILEIDSRLNSSLVTSSRATVKKGRVMTKSFSALDGFPTYLVETLDGKPLECFRGQLIKLPKANEKFAIGDVLEIVDKVGYSGNFLRQGKIEDFDPKRGILVLEDTFDKKPIVCDTDQVIKLSVNEKKITPLCYHMEKYMNVISKNLKFWYCPSCKQDVGYSGNFLRQGKIEDFYPKKNILKNTFNKKPIVCDTDQATKLSVNKKKIAPMCDHKEKYMNVISKNLKFWYCPSCKQEVGSKDQLLAEFEKMLGEV